MPQGAAIADGGHVQPDVTPILRASGIVKSFGRHRALDNVELAIMPGTVHGLVGENGAGKSTLGKILSGVIRPDEGLIEVGGEAVSFSSPGSALAAGITIMQQELSLAPDLTVAENVLLGRYPSRFGLVTRRQLWRDFEALIGKTGFEVDGSACTGDLPIAKQQEVEILRALSRDARVIIMDEPTSSLSAHDVQRLHAVVRQLRSSGIAVIYISHFLEEVLSLSDEVTIMRNGRRVRSLAAPAATVEMLVTSMTGAAKKASFPSLPTVAQNAPAVLEVRGLQRRSGDAGLDLTVRAGEIVGLFGLVGSGRSELVQMIFGAAGRQAGGEVLIDGRIANTSSPARSLASGIAMLPESRKEQGLFLGLKQRENATIACLKTLSSGGVIHQRAERSAAVQELEAMGVSPVTPEGEVGTLSGGNQQKVLFAKTLLSRPRVLLLDEPTRGVDVGARRAIYDIVVSLVTAGMAVILISSEYDEVANMSHRLLVMRDGRISAELDTSAATHEAALAAAFGVAASSSLVKEMT
jgi:rhamnose transport system ATP-binding protein